MERAHRAFPPALAICALTLLTGCLSSTANGNTVAMIPNYSSGGQQAAAAAALQGVPANQRVIDTTLADTSPTQMSITLSQDVAPAGPVTFVITNAGTMKHELVGFQTNTPAGSIQVSGFEGDPNRINEDTAGKVVIDTGNPFGPGVTKVVTVDMKAGHYALVCNLSGHYQAGMHQDFWVTPAGSTPVLATLSDTSPTQMSIALSQDVAPTGKVTFVITNAGTMKHELVGFKTNTPAGSIQVSGFEGDPNRINEDTAGKVVIDTGNPFGPGVTKVVTVDMKAGHYALVCNLSGHYQAGMHQDFWVTPAGSTPVLATLSDTSPTQMSIALSQDVAPTGKVTFVITNAGTMKHELVGFKTNTPAGSIQVSGFEGDPNRINEDTAGKVVIDTGNPFGPGVTKVVTVDMKAGHYALVCNLSGHYQAGMHQDFWVTPAGSTPVLATLSDTSPTQMSITLSQNVAPTGKVTFVITNAGTMKHELVGFKTNTPAGSIQVSGFEGDPNRINEDTAGKVVIDTGNPFGPGVTKVVTVDMKAGHYA